jgi:hypothetical protein
LIKTEPNWKWIPLWERERERERGKKNYLFVIYLVVKSKIEMF